MRVFYLDAGLRNELGHHANWCRFIAGELRRRGIETRVYGVADLDRGLAAELDATAHFRHWTYRLFDPDPICGWLTAFHAAVETTVQDLARIDDVRPDDVVWVNSAFPAQLLAAARWLAALAPERRPPVLVEFAIEPGLEAKRAPDGGFVFSAKDPRQDPRAILLRFAGQQIAPELGAWLRPLTFDPNCSAIYNMLLERPVAALPMPHQATTSRRDRTGRRPITIALLGHQRADKGYELVPEIAKILLRQRKDIRLLVHNAQPGAMPAAQQAMRNLAAADRRVALDERVAGPALMTELIEATDLMLCPYLPERYITSHSSVAAEALANGIPLVVPDATAVAKQLQDFGGSGAAFARFDARHIAKATLQVVEDFDRYAGLAREAAERWATRHGPEHLVTALLALAGGKN